MCFDSDIWVRVSVLPGVEERRGEKDLEDVMGPCGPGLT